MAEQGSGRLGDAIIAPLKDPADVHLDDTSDAILEHLAPFRDKMTGKLRDLYKKWITHPSRNLGIAFQPAFGEGSEENQLINELHGFGFGYFFGASGRAANLAAAAKAAQDAETQVKQELSAAWSGKAADAASEKLDDLTKALGEYNGYVGGFGQLMRHLWDATRKPIVDLSEIPDGGSPKVFLDAHNPDDCDGMGMFIDRLNDAINWGRKGPANAEVALSAKYSTGPIAAQDIRRMSIDLDTGFDSKWSDMLCNQMDEYSQQYSNAMATFREAIRNTHTAVQNALRAFSDGLNVPTDPFGSLHLGKGGTPGNTKPSDTGGGGRDTGGGGGTQTPPPVSPPPTAVEPPKPPDPNVNPVTHKPLETNPETGQPYPIDPKTGDAIKGDMTQPETMTVEQGKDKISMAEPDKDGKMEVTVDDGSGHPKDYKLDFDDDKAKPQADGTPQPGAQDKDAAGGAIHRDTAQNQANPPGTPGAQDSAAQGYHPGPDGKIHIEDGNLKITAERPDGPGGPTVVTVDNGSGDPTKYTLGQHAAVDGKTDAVAQATEPDTTGQGAGRHAAVPAGQNLQDQAVQHSGELPVEPQGRHHVEQMAQEGAAGGTGGFHETASADAPATGDTSAAGSADPAAASSDSTSPQSLADPLAGHDDLREGSQSGSVDVDPSVAANSGADAHAGSGLGAAPGGTGQPAAGGMGMMGGGMMGGMGGAANGGGGGEEQQRGSSPYRVDGGLFEAASTASRISGSLDDDEGVIGQR
ncbi:hypothetical protein [Amycolatopsis sp. H20-H5]|uniref:hypothetical protein n=1 Tax=Amycolatopsis sp. H20-H5 TaxID=3046309 RepID=UPI002DBB6181|nr:hypothetical protein [Amycolatopsis sp. H20-H5]MEC3980231.1 hypothetical protein [Amycolatopsis sp. H20-H5]